MIAQARFVTHLYVEDDDMPVTLIHDLIYISGILSTQITVPRGFVTDLASIPRLIQPLIPKEGRYNRAAVVHDWLYAKNPLQLNRRTADAVLLEAMHAVGVDAERAEAIWLGVRAGGWWPWRKYRKAGK